jgi:hypothetical protein
MGMFAVVESAIIVPVGSCEMVFVPDVLLSPKNSQNAPPPLFSHHFMASGFYTLISLF